MPREAGLWRTVRDHLAPYGFLERIENRVSDGGPDVYFCLRHPLRETRIGVEGRLELKRVPAWPKRGKVVVGMRDAQTMWHEAVYAAGGRSWILVKVGNDVFLFEGREARWLEESRTQDELVERSKVLATSRKFPASSVALVLTSPTRST